MKTYLEDALEKNPTWSEDYIVKYECPSHFGPEHGCPDDYSSNDIRIACPKCWNQIKEEESE